MTMLYYLAIIECDQDKFDEASGRQLSHAMTKLKAATEGRGDTNIWQVTDERAIRKFKQDLQAGMHK